MIDYGNLAAYGVEWFDPPSPVWICSCGHEEAAHVVHTEIAYDFTHAGEVSEEYEVETYPCAKCDGLCQNFEVWS